LPDVQQGKFTIEVFFYPVRPAEKIIITVAQQDSGAAAADR
jgi:phage tail sheath protein FI